MNDTTTVGKQVGKLLVRIETSSILSPTVGQLVCRCCIVHTHQLEFANTIWPLACRVKAALMRAPSSTDVPVLVARKIVHRVTYSTGRDFCATFDLF